MRIPLLRTVDLLAQAVESAGVRTADLHAVLLVGGSSRIPLVSRLIAGELGVPVTLDAHPKYAVCLGAAIAAGARLAPPAPPAPPVPTGLRRVGRPGRPPAPPRSASPARLPPPAAPVVAAAADEPPAPLEVDLPATGITAVVDTFVPTTPTVPAWRPVVTDVDEPLVVTVTGDRGRGRRAVLVAAGAAVLVVAALAALLVRPGAAATGDDTAPTTPPSAPPPSPTPAPPGSCPRTGDRGAR